MRHIAARERNAPAVSAVTELYQLGTPEVSHIDSIDQIGPRRFAYELYASGETGRLVHHPGRPCAHVRAEETLPFGVRYIKPRGIILRQETSLEGEVLRLEAEKRRERQRSVGTPEPRRRIVHIEPRPAEHRPNGERISDVHSRTDTLDSGVHTERPVLVGTEDKATAVLVVKVADRHEEVVIRPARILIGYLAALVLLLITAQYRRIQLALHTRAEFAKRIVQFQVVVRPYSVRRHRVAVIIYQTVRHIPYRIGFKTTRKPSVIGGLLSVYDTGRHKGRRT